MALIIHILNGLICAVLGVNLGIHLLATDLFYQNRISYNEFKYITSWQYTWKVLNPFKNKQ